VIPSTALVIQLPSITNPVVNFKQIGHQFHVQLDSLVSEVPMVLYLPANLTLSLEVHALHTLVVLSMTTHFAFPLQSALVLTIASTIFAKAFNLVLKDKPATAQLLALPLTHATGHLKLVVFALNLHL